MVKLVRVTDDRNTWKGADGKERSSSNVYVELVINDKVRRFRIKPCFANDRTYLDMAIDEYLHYDKDGNIINKK